jgi:hypothetical protein
LRRGGAVSRNDGPGTGLHAVAVNGGMYTAIAPAKNAIFRVTGDLPVELMNLSVE